MKKAISFLLIFFITFLNSQAIYAETTTAELADKLSNFEKGFFVSTNDVDGLLARTFAAYPRLEFYYRGYSDTYRGDRHLLDIKYDNTDIDQSNIHIANSTDDIDTIVENGILNCDSYIYFITGVDFDSQNFFSNLIDNSPLKCMGVSAWNISSLKNTITQKTCYTLKLEYSLDKDTLIQYKKGTEAKAQQIICENICKSMPDYQKVKIIHDYVVENTVYEEYGSVAHIAYGALINGRGVCESYANAVKILLDMVGIENIMISGQATNSNGTDSHAWNLVKLGNNYYHLDATWDDPVSIFGGDKLEYDYFLVDDETIKADHSWDESLYPSANGTEYNYKAVKDLIKSSNRDYNDYYSSADFTSIFDNYVADSVTETTTDDTTEYTTQTGEPFINIPDGFFEDLLFVLSKIVEKIFEYLASILDFFISQ